MVDVQYFFGEVSFSSYAWGILLLTTGVVAGVDIFLL
jgi:hypothetical protein